MSYPDDAAINPPIPAMELDVANTERDPSAIDVTEAVAEAQSGGNFLRRHMLKLSAGAFVVGMVASPVSVQETVNEVIEQAPWAGGAIAASEASFAVGIAMMLGAAGKRIGNPFKLRQRWAEAKAETSQSRLFRNGLYVNAAGAIGTPVVAVAAGVTSLPKESWPGAFGIAAADIASTILIRKGILSGLDSATTTEGASIKEEASTKKESRKPFQVRLATFDDIDRLAELDLEGFEGAYGEQPPAKSEIAETFTQRLANNPGWMYVVEVGGTVEGFVTAFKTDKSIDDFVSWEDTTANGTLEDRVKPDGKYVYAVNLTMSRSAMKAGGYDSAIANLFANSIREGVDYAYFVSRMPGFRSWLEKTLGPAQPLDQLSQEEIQRHAEAYYNWRVIGEEGKSVPYDPQLRMYEQTGFKLRRLVPGAFSDAASLDYGVVCKVEIPPANNTLKSIKPVRVAMAGLLRQAAKRPKLLKKVF